MCCAPPAAVSICIGWEDHVQEDPGCSRHIAEEGSLAGGIRHSY